MHAIASALMFTQIESSEMLRCYFSEICNILTDKNSNSNHDKIIRSVIVIIVLVVVLVFIKMST